MNVLKYTIPTKQHDGGARPTKPHRVGEPDADAFSRYSSDLLRMKALLLSPEEDEVNDDLGAARKINQIFRNAGLSDVLDLDINHIGNAHAHGASSKPKRRRGDSSRCVQNVSSRKTRLSYELHPDILLQDIMEQLELEESEAQAQAISDDEEELEDEEQEQLSEGHKSSDDIKRR